MLSKARPHAAVVDFILIIHISGNAAAWLWVVIRASAGHGPSGSRDGHSGLGSADQPSQGRRRAAGTCAPVRGGTAGEPQEHPQHPALQRLAGPSWSPPSCAGWWRSRPGLGTPTSDLSGPFPRGHGGPLQRPSSPGTTAPCVGEQKRGPSAGNLAELGRNIPDVLRDTWLTVAWI